MKLVVMPSKSNVDSLYLCNKFFHEREIISGSKTTLARVELDPVLMS